MIDFDDASDMFWFGIIFNGWTAIVCIIVGVVFMFLAQGNSSDCEKMMCEIGKPRLMNNTCLCVSEAK